uniref:FBD domain-containing protein n=1 Tax=Setaria italica TaxID=4555 RepID=K3ZM15_SETIT
MEEPNCFGVQLAKFFAENAVVLEEISIDDGNHKMREHMNHMLG